MSGQLADALRMERVRVLTLRSTYVLAATAVLLGACVALLVSVGARQGRLDPGLSGVVLTGGAEFVPLPFAAVLTGVLGVLGVGHDYRHGLVRPVLTALPGRSALVLARLGVLAAAGAVVVVAGVAVNAAVASALTGSVPQLDAGTWRAVGGYLVLVVLWAWLGAGATWLLRSTAPVLTVLLLVPLVVEPVVSLLSVIDQLHWLRPVVRWLPFAAGRQLVSSVDPAGVTGGLTPLQGGLTFGALVAAVLVSAWVVFVRRDA